MTQTDKNNLNLNRKYFESLIATRASMGVFGIGWAGLFVSYIGFAIHNVTGPDFNVPIPFDILSQVMLFSMVFMGISFLVNFIEPVRKYFYHYQKFSSIWQLVFVFVLMLSLFLLGGS